MEQWVPLFVAIVGAVAAVGVAFWNSRGESAELRQLKAMNEVLSGLDSDVTEAKKFTEARDALLTRVAARVIGAPKRRTTALALAAGVVGIAAAVWIVATLAPTLTDSQVATLGNALLLVVSAGGVAMGWLAIDMTKTTEKRARRRRNLPRGVESE